MSRLLWLGNAPWCPSGYGEQAALFLPRLAGQGHEVAAVANYGLQGRETRWNGITVYPSDGCWGNRNLGVWADQYRADQVIALCDAWVLKPDVWPDGLSAAVWAPVDHWPIPPAVLAVLQQDQISPIAMSRFGYDLMQTFELDPIYVPHGVDTTMFRPQREIRDAVRDELDIPHDVFLVGMVGANVGNPSMHRKGFDKAFLAFNEFARRHDDAWMYVHANAAPQDTGFPLDELATVIGMPPGRLRFPHAKAFELGIPTQALAYTYQAFDVLLQPSLGEGFGVPILEAQACGVPVAVSDHSAMTELCGAGWLIEGDPLWDPLQKSFFISPHVRPIVDALEAAYDHRDDLELRGRVAAFAADYDADQVADLYWKPALERLLAGRREEAVA